MKQAKRPNSYSGELDSDYADKHHGNSETFKTSTLKTRTNVDIHGSLKKIVGLLKNVSAEYENDLESHRNFRISKEVTDLNAKYSAQFSIIACEFEKWAAHRRKLLKDLGKFNNDLIRTKMFSSAGKMTFSIMDLIGTVGSLVLHHSQSNLSNKVLYAAASFGCLSVVCSLIEKSKMKFIAEEVVKELKEDTEIFHRIQMLIQKLHNFDKSIKELFPHGIDPWIVQSIQEPDEDESIQQKSHIQTAIGELDLSSKQNLKISLAIILSNAGKEPELLKDRDFLMKVHIFSKSSVAEKWWNRMKCFGMLPVADKTKMYAEFNSLRRFDSVSMNSFPLFSGPMWHLSGLPTVGSLILNAVVLYDTYFELNGSGSKVEDNILRQAKQRLEEEYKNVKELYEQLSPHGD